MPKTHTGKVLELKGCLRGLEAEDFDVTINNIGSCASFGVEGEQCIDCKGVRVVTIRVLDIEEVRL